MKLHKKKKHEIPQVDPNDTLSDSVIQKEHNTIPQLDGHDESFGNTTSKVEDKETQTDILDTKSVDDAKRNKPSPDDLWRNICSRNN